MRLYRNPCTSIGPIFLGTWGSLIVHASCSYIHMGSLIVHPSCFYIHRGSLIINPSCSHIHRGSLIVHPSCSYIHRNHALHNILGLFFREVGFLHSQKPIYPVLIHWKNKLVVLTTEWLPQLQTSWRDSGYERFALVLETNKAKGGGQALSVAEREAERCSRC